MKAFKERTARLATLPLAVAFLAALWGTHPSAIDAADSGQTVIASSASDLVPRGASITLLPDGRQLTLGGAALDGGVLRAGQIISSEGVTPVAGMHLGRTGHTATVLPNGLVLIMGGIGADGSVLAPAEFFDPATGAFTQVAGRWLQPRADHAATLMTDGRVLITGGFGADGRLIREAEVLDTATGKVETVRPELETARFGHISSLLPNSPVLVVGGYDEGNRPLQSGELYDPVTQRFIKVPGAELSSLSPGSADAAVPAIAGGIPPAGAVDFPVDGRLSVRFSTRLDVRTLNSETVVLQGPTGRVLAKVVGAEGGLLVFITPDADLVPGADYVLYVYGPADMRGAQLAFGAISFRTATISAAIVAGNAAASHSDSGSHSFSIYQPSTNEADDDATNLHVKVTEKPTIDGEDDEEWVPGPQHMHGDWNTHRTFVAAATTKKAVPSGGTSLSGRVLRLNGKPLANVTVSVADRKSLTDEDGQFTLLDVPSGKQTFVVDGKTADRSDAKYGFYESLISITAGQANDLGYTVWMPKLDTARNVKIPSPTTREIVLTSPRIPGFEVRIPAGTILRDRQGRIVTEIGITAVPVDRPPFPQPPMEFPVYYTVQPGGVTVQSAEGQKVSPVRLTYPNYVNAPIGARAHVWLYDPTEKGWYVYGQGTVSNDRKTIGLDPDVGLYEFTGGAFTFGPDPGLETKPPEDDDDGDEDENCECDGVGDPSSNDAGDPVALWSGALLRKHVDLRVRDILPLRVNRIYRSTNPNLGMFGYGWSSSLDWYLYSTAQDRVTLVMASGVQIPFTRVSGTGWNDGLFTHTTSPGKFYGSKLQSINDGNLWWLLTLQDGRSYRFDHHGGAKLNRIADRYGNTIIITRVNDVISSIEGPSGRKIIFTSNPDGTISNISDAAGRSVSYSYLGGYLNTVTDASNGITTYGYVANRLSTVTDPRNHLILTTEYDANGRVWRQTLADLQTIQFAYTVDANGKVTQTDVTDQRAKVRRVAFNGDGYITSSTYPVGTAEQQTTTFSRQVATGRLDSMTDALSRMTTYGYDGYNNLATITRLAGTPDAVTWTYTYEPYFQQIKTITDPLNHTWTYGFDAARNPVTLADPLGHITTYGFNAIGQVTSITDALHHTWTYGFTGPDLTSVTDPLARASTMVPDAVGRISYVTDPNGHTTRIELDGKDRIKRITDALGGIVELAYDLAGNMTSHKDQRINATAFGFDTSNRLASKTDPLGHVETYSYGANGRIQRITDRKGQVRGYSYDYLNRVSQVGFGATPAAPTSYTSTVTYTFDGGNRLKQLVDSVNGTISRDYDGLNRLKLETTPEGSVAYTYDTAGRRSTMQVTGQTPVTYGWDDANRLTSITQGTDVVTFAYDDADRRVTTTLANGVAETYGYDNANQLISITYNKSGATLGNLTYSYDNAGRRTAVSGTLSSTNLPSAIASATYNVNNQLSSWNGVTHTYDLNGNLSSDNLRSYAWNERDQLAYITGTNTAAFVYDAMFRRRKKTIDGVETSFLYDQDNIVQELRGGSVLANLLTGFTDEVFLRREGASRSHFLTDAVRSTIALTDDNGVVQRSYAYGAYGDSSASGAATGNTQTYTGREDDGVGLMFYRARYYAPSKHRFISEDPIGIFGGPNSYVYADGNPISRIDPSGTQSVMACAQPQNAAICAEAGIINGGMRPGVVLLIPPNDAKDKDGAKAPGKPGADEGFKDPKDGEQWVPNPNPGAGGSSHGWLDDQGRVWCPTGKGGRAHGGAHWDVQEGERKRRYKNVRPGQDVDDQPWKN